MRFLVGRPDALSPKAAPPRPDAASFQNLQDQQNQKAIERIDAAEVGTGVNDDGSAVACVQQRVHVVRDLRLFAQNPLDKILVDALELTEYFVVMELVSPECGTLRLILRAMDFVFDTQPLTRLKNPLEYLACRF
jgi:hypothetical protein